MSRALQSLAAAADAASDRLDAVVVRDVRQGLRTRTFWLALTVLLGACLVAAFVAAAEVSEQRLESHGGSLATFYVGLLQAVLLLFLPAQLYLSLQREISSNLWELLSLTGTSARRFLWGKVASLLVQGTLYATAVLPFLVLSYLLNGVNLAELGVRLLTIAVVTVLALVVMAGLAAVGRGRLLRGVLLAVFILLLTQVPLFLGVLAMGGGWSTVRTGGIPWLGLSAVLFGVASVALVLMEGGVARLRPGGSDWSRGLRWAIVGQALGVALFGGLFIQDGTDAKDAFDVTGVLLSLQAWWMGAFLCSEPAPPRVVGRRWGPSRLLSTGGSSGLLLTGALFLHALLVVLVVAALTGWRAPKLEVVVFPAYCLLYLALALLVAGAPGLRRLGRAARRAAVLAGLPCVFLVEALLTETSSTTLPLGPVSGVAVQEDAPGFGLPVIVWSLALLSAWAAFVSIRRAERRDGGGHDEAALAGAATPTDAELEV